MSTSLFLENQSKIGYGFNEVHFHTNVLEIGRMVERLDRKDIELFSRIVETFKTDNRILGKTLALELIRIRTMKSNLLVARELIYRYKIKCLK